MCLNISLQPGEDFIPQSTLTVLKEAVKLRLVLCLVVLRILSLGGVTIEQTQVCGFIIFFRDMRAGTHESYIILRD